MMRDTGKHNPYQAGGRGGQDQEGQAGDHDATQTARVPVAASTPHVLTLPASREGAMALRARISGRLWALVLHHPPVNIVIASGAPRSSHASPRSPWTSFHSGEPHRSTPQTLRTSPARSPSAHRSPSAPRCPLRRASDRVRGSPAGTSRHAPAPPCGLRRGRDRRSPRSSSRRRRRCRSRHRPARRPLAGRLGRAAELRCPRPGSPGCRFVGSVGVHWSGEEHAQANPRPLQKAWIAQREGIHCPEYRISSHAQYWQGVRDGCG